MLIQTYTSALAQYMFNNSPMLIEWARGLALSTIACNLLGGTVRPVECWGEIVAPYADYNNRAYETDDRAPAVVLSGGEYKGRRISLELIAINRLAGCALAGPAMLSAPAVDVYLIDHSDNNRREQVGAFADPEEVADLLPAVLDSALAV
jgi:hypothetical protein